jgi:hypothetical protein
MSTAVLRLVNSLLLTASGYSEFKMVGQTLKCVYNKFYQQGNKALTMQNLLLTT